MTDKTVMLYPYHNKSRGARALCESLGIPWNRQDRIAGVIAMRTEAGKKVDTLINWGSGSLPQATSNVSRILNKVRGVNIARDKTRFFTRCAEATDGPRIPEFTVDPEVAITWVKEGIVVMGRANTGSCGLDIDFFDENPEGFTESDLWVQYKKKKHEFRVHIVGETVILIQKKVLPSVDPDGNPIPRKEVDFRVRNHRNGFIFQRYDVNCPNDVVDQAKKALKVTNLDFGAVDVIWNEHEGKAYVLEVNSAPGLEGSTVEDYRKAFVDII